ncbi:polysaccharide deacetylase family protein [Sinorhizobium medicae]|nr:polysaccharide deacetylase family protein [Sinorhizobium medicae]
MNLSKAFADTRHIAFSFDDAPTGNSERLSGMERTLRLIDGLSRAGVQEAIFFSTTNNLARGTEATIRLTRYVEAGHVLANHGHNHLPLSRTSFDDYLSDILLARQALRKFEGVAPFFRHPFLDEGKSRAAQENLVQALIAHGLRNGHVTIKTYDFFLQQLLDEATSSGKEVNYDALRGIYIDLIVGCAEFYDQVARDILGRSPAHVILLHENDLAAYFIVDLVHSLFKKGWRTIPARVAYDDPLFAANPDTVFRNQGLIAAIAHAAGWRKSDLVPIEEEEQYISALFTNCIVRQ